MNNLIFSGINELTGLNSSSIKNQILNTDSSQKSIGSIGKVSGQDNNIAEIQKAVVKKNYQPL